MRQALGLILLGFVLGASIEAQQPDFDLDAPVIVAPSSRQITQLADLDGDGAKDAIGWWWASNGQYGVVVTAFKNVGGVFVPQTQSTVNFFAYYPNIMDVPSDCVGDFNGDGLEDYAASGWTIAVALFANPPTNSTSLAAPTIVNIAGLPSPSRACVAGDFNSDGFDDLAITGEGWMSIHISTGSGFLPAAVTMLPATPETPDLDVGDVDADGDDDILRTEAGTLRVMIVENGLVQSTLTFPHAATHYMTAFGDIDQDGDGDVTIFDDSTYTVFRAMGPASFSPEPVRSGGPAYALADVDQDGDLDGICCSGTSGPTPYTYNDGASTFHIAINDGTGNFAPAFTLPSVGSLHIAGADDVDQDGDVDLVAGRCVYYARGPIGPDSCLTSGLATDTGRIAIDFDDDGDRDAAPEFSSFMRADGAGRHFSSANVIPPPPSGKVYIGPVVSGDFDGDGDEDMVVRTATSTGQISTPRRLMRIAGNVFQSAGNATGGGIAFMPTGTDESNIHVVTGDLDQDGDLDLIITRVPRIAAGPKIWLNDGGGFFSPGPPLPPTFEPSIAADLNQDGLIDLVGCLSARPEIVWGVGNGVFVAPAWGTQFSPNWSLSVPSGFQDIANVRGGLALFDRHNDGDLDVAAATSSGIVFYTNTPTGFAWGNLMAFASHRRPLSEIRIFFADVTGDGFDDMIDNAVGATEGFRVLAYNPITSDYDIETYYAGDVFFVDDHDGDGDIDVVGPHVSRGTQYEGPSAGKTRQYGSGFPGTAGVTPQLAATTPMREGQVCSIRVCTGLGGSATYIGFGPVPSAISPAAYPGITIAVDPFIGIIPAVLGGLPGAVGAGDFTLTYTAPLGFAGIAVYVQAAVIDPGSPYGFSLTQGLETIYGQ